MGSREASIGEVVEAMDVIVKRDGGSVGLVSDGGDSGVIQIRYDEGHNDECESCAIPAEMLREFIAEGLRSHSVRFAEVSVVDGDASA